MSRFKIFIVTIHIAGWLLFMAFPLLFLNGGGNSNATAVLQNYSYWLYGATYIILFYLNAYLFIPRFFLRKKYVDYAIIVFVLLSCVYVIKPYDKLVKNNETHFNFVSLNGGPGFGPPQGMQPQGPPPNSTQKSPAAGLQGAPPQGMQPQGPPPNSTQKSPTAWPQGAPPANHPQFNNQPGGNLPWPPHGRRLDSTSLFIFLMIIAISTAIKVMQQWQLTEQRAARAETDKANAELSFLKAQINPHFLFNTLNNIYTLAVTHDDNAADSIMKLSNIMRYVTDEVSTDFVPLQNEVDCLSDYIELQRLRMNENTPVNYTVRGNMEQKTIPPLILMTFVENIFKYGISKQEPSIIDINIDVSENAISFFCQNKIFIRNSDTQRMGIGIKNTKQRLDYLYQGRHLLYITNDDEFYTVQLVLQT
jgi:two-component system LytT family sensor kinase